MANFMGPMAPPQAAPPQPQKLDIRTSPGQRQQFKDFMRQRTAMMPMTSAPVAPPPMMPMMPQMPPQMPLRMEMGGDVDIFESQNYHDGGVVSSLDRLQDLATMGSAFSEQLQSTVMGEGADRMRLTGGIGGSLSLSGPGSPRPPISISPPPGADVSAFFDNLRGRLSNQDLKIADRSGTGINNPDPAPTLNSSKPDNTRLLGSGDNIDQGFLNSPEFKNLDFTGPATQEIYNSPYFGTIMSGSQGRMQDAAYEAYLERTGKKVPAGTPTAPMQPARNLFSGTVEPKSYGLAGMGTTFSFENGGGVPSFYTLFKAGQGGDSGEVNKIFIGSKQDTAAARQLAGSGQTAPNPTDNLNVIGGAGIDPYDVRMARLAEESAPTTAPNQLTAPGLPISPPPPPPDIVDPFPVVPQDVIRQSDVIVPSSRSEVDIGDFPMPVQPNYPFPITPGIQAGLDSIAPVGLGLPANLLGDLSDGSLRFDDGGAVPPRNVEIKGQPHMLSYITPDEADILEALGGSGEPGPMGIPSYPGGYGGEGMGGFGAGSGGGGRGGPPGGRFGGRGTTGQDDSSDDGTGRLEDADARVAAEQAAQEAAAAEAARQAEAERARQAREVQAQIQQAIAVSQEQKAKQQQDLVNRQMDRFEAGFNQIGPTPETNISATSTTSPSDVSFGVESTDMTTDKYAEEAADLLGLADDLLGIPDDFVATRPGQAPVDDVDDTPEVLGMDDEYDDVVGTPDYDDPNRSGYKAGLPTGLEFADTRRGRFTTNLAGLTAEQRAALPGYMDPTDVYGYEFDNTGRVTGMVGPGLNMPGFISSGLSLLSDIFGTPPETTEDLLDQGLYTGFGEGSRIGEPDAGGRDTPVIKLPTDPCPEGFVMKDGACTPIAPTGDGGSGSLGNIPTSPPPTPTSPVIVPSTRQPIPNTLQGPVGYGMPTAGQINPFAVSSAAMYQQMLNEQAKNQPRQFAPIRFQDGGPVSPDLDRAADNFLQSLMPAA